MGAVWGLGELPSRLSPYFHSLLELPRFTPMHVTVPPESPTTIRCCLCFPFGNKTNVSRPRMLLTWYNSFDVKVISMVEHGRLVQFCCAAQCLRNVRSGCSVLAKKEPPASTRHADTRIAHTHPCAQDVCAHPAMCTQRPPPTTLPREHSNKRVRTIDPHRSFTLHTHAHVVVRCCSYLMYVLVVKTVLIHDSLIRPTCTCSD